MENLRFISRAIIDGHVTPQCRCELSLNPWWIDIGPGFAALFSPPFPPPGAVEYAIDYTTDRGGSRCLRLIPIPRNRRSTSHVRFNIFDRYFVPRLSPSHLVLRYTRYGWNYHGCWRYRIFDRRPRRFLFGRISKSSPRAVPLSLFIFSKKDGLCFETRGGVERRWRCTKMEGGFFKIGIIEFLI